MAYLILVRHGLTDWNNEGRWQGFTDTSINQKGIEEIQDAARSIKDIKIDKVYTSNLLRTKQSYQQICDVLGLKCPVSNSSALNERDYGIYTGKNKWDLQKQIGQEEFEKLRRGFDYPIPAGETLHDVYERVVPFYKSQILEDLKRGKNVLLVSSGNTFRALIKYLENLSDTEVEKLELGFGEVYIFNIDQMGIILEKQIRSGNIIDNNQKDL